MADAPLTKPKIAPWEWRVALLVVVALIAAVNLYFIWRFNRDEPVTYASLEDHFKYGSTGGERESGIPYWIWKVLPKMFPEYLPGKTYTPGTEYISLGFLYEPGKDLPIGASRRNTQGIDRVFLNCAICHAGSVRETPQSSPFIYTGMPSNTVDLEAFERFIFACASDQRFNAPRIMAEMESIGAKYDFINRLIMRYYAIPFMRERLLMLKGHFRFVEWEPEAGPGRTDTFNPAKTLLEFPLEKIADARAGRALRFSIHLVARSAQGARAACALGRKQQHDGGAQQERGVRHRHVSANDRSQVGRASGAMAA